RFQFPGSSGQGVNVYLVDTGVNIDHEDLEGRASYGPTFIGDQDDPTDINGHGTFVAGVCCGKTYGVAKKANVISLKTLDKDGSGRLSNVLLALHWIVQQHMATPWVKKIVNLSLATAYHLPTNQAIQEAMHLGLHFSIAAGNQGTDACKFSPASTSGALVVGAIAQDDSIPSFSNSGSCVTIYAPGTGIKSIWNQDNQATKTLSGTSMAAPHLAGVMALLLADDDYTPPALVEKILSSATYVEDRNIRILRLNMPNLMDNNGQSNNISHDHQVATTMSDKQPVGAMRGGFLVLSSANKDIAITLFLFFVAFAHTLYHML
ncbi:peptidase S8/S53 domain-containing protein, partial [Radiomyces spectabilis]|uniref:peptidase S8/S53 domain-containing protein n=1 Tax=Radiomyces spectabilis TaxID=64574 RepID=UPI002220132A